LIHFCHSVNSQFLHGPAEGIPGDEMLVPSWGFSEWLS
jgi:hypothetical protein